MNYLTPDGEFFWEYITGRYQIDISEIDILDGIIFYAGGVIVDEIAILRLADKADAASVSDLLLAYADRRRVAFSGYAPIQAGILANAVVRANGYHVALLVTEDPKGAQSAFLELFSEFPPAGNNYTILSPVINNEESNYSGESKPDEPAIMDDEISQDETKQTIDYAEQLIDDEAEIVYEDDAYNRSSVLGAWYTGSTAMLSPMNRRVFDKCVYVINSVITDDMNEFDKQLAIINWIIMWSVYDPEFLSNSPTATPDPNNDNPYGVLINQVGNCFGFTYTFQLFMDLLGIESMVVHGYDFTGGLHAWNLVHIYGNWYAVDVTLDVTLNNPLGVDISHKPQYITHRHLNVTSEYLWNELGHYWDWFSVPIAE
ncbi:MAG: DUF4358 domain-containing protein [Oscillospiraceae bacterium]|nr:DUF4358 domain-containing protein [Oscillospiraceae bacterium]